MNKKNIKLVIMMMKKTHTALAIVLLLAFVGTVSTYARGWKAPDDQKEKKSYIKFDASTAAQGEALYNANCASCHGNPGKNNALKSLNPIPPDLSSAATQSLTDGELIYILNNGAGLMPSFKNSLGEEKEWMVISYLRGFNKNYVQELSKFDPAKSKLVKLVSSFDKASNTISVKATADEKNGTIAIAGAEISLFVKRYFGNFQIDKSAKTDAGGMAKFTFPTDLPGNKEGELDVLVKMFDENYGEVQSTTKYAIGVPTDNPGLNDNRAIWNVVAKAPFWVIGLYSTGLIAFLLLLAFLLNNLRKIFISKTIKN
jgi:mono/diheme cytochrome c family protein